jgi:uncharacterized membrane protein
MVAEQNSKEPRRNRIVINIDSASGGVRRGGRKRGRWSRIFGVAEIIIVGFLIIAAAGAFFWWRHYKTTPAYSLALLVDAVERNDTAFADQLIETDKVLANLASQVTEKAASSSQTSRRSRPGFAARPEAKRSRCSNNTD